MPRYPFREIEEKWQAHWAESGQHHAVDDDDRPRIYLLIEFPYPSGAGLHVGHPRSYVALDVLARKRRMQGFNVLYPIGFDAFGLPAENFAIATGTHPRETTEKNIANYRRQLRMLGISFDWEREVNTTDPAYYKWTQWTFLKMFEKGLAYKAEVPINWCTSCNVGLANEEVVAGRCERCDTEVRRRMKSQWMLRITAYAERLLDDLDTVDFIRPVVMQQRNWIGRSEGASIRFPVGGGATTLEVFTTRPDTVFGATYMVVSPEHPLLDDLADRITNRDDVRAYALAAAAKSDLERTDLAGEKTGVRLEGLTATNPATGEEIPIWTADYVMMTYGTGAIMAVPGHDDRDWEFAKKFGIEIREVVSGGDVAEAAFTDVDDGTMVNSGLLDGLQASGAIGKAVEWLAREGLGEAQIQYKLRDWVFSRQRYWGEPIPLVHCDECGWVAIPESDLPLELPEVDEFRPGEDGQSPLAGLEDWIAVPCPSCGKPGRRETDTMPQWAGSCWYFLRYLDPHNDEAFADPELIEKWMPVDWYNGGMEHTTLHLLYSRFWCKFLHDEGYLPMAEPYARRTSHGMILGEDGDKMSKSRGNVVNPDAVVHEYGTDTFRTFEMYLGTFDQTAAWSTAGLIGVHRFLNRVWEMVDLADPDAAMDDADLRLLHGTIRDVSDRIEALKFNTAVASLMTMLNELGKKERIPQPMMETFCRLLNPFAPHVAEEMHERLGGAGSVELTPWPVHDPELAKHDRVTIPIQVNGKLRDRVELAADPTEEEVLAAAYASAKIQTHLAGRDPRKTIYIPNRLLNLII